MQLYSQNDPKWKSNKHGTSNSTLGATGCTITGLAMLLKSIGYDETPATVNDKLTANGGYASGNLIIWSAINKIWPRAKFTWRGHTYTDDDNAKIADAIKQYGGCLVAVNGTPIGGAAKDGHWVVYIGNKRLNDPWDGKEKATSAYSATGYAIIELTDPSNEGAQITIDAKLFEELVSKATKYDGFKNGGYENIEAVEKAVDGFDKTITSLNQLVTDKNNAVIKLQSSLDTKQSELTDATSRVNSLTDQVKKIPEMQTQLDHLTEEKTKWSQAETTYNRTIAQLRSENDKFREKSFSLLVSAVLDKLLKRFQLKKKGGGNG